MGLDGYYGEHPALELINSQRWYGRGPTLEEDLLHQPGWLAGFVPRWEFGDPPDPNRGDIARLATLRDVFRRAYTAVADGRDIARRDVASIDDALAAAPLRRRVGVRGGVPTVRREPVSHDWRWVAAEVAASFVELIATGERERVKLCANPECLCAFYDESKNRSRRWCYPEVCGNLHKVRQFRERRRRAGQSSPSR